MTYQGTSEQEVIVKENVVQDNRPDMDGLPGNSIDRRERVEVVRDSHGERQQRVVENVGAERQSILSKLILFVWVGTGILEFLILLRMLLLLLAANPSNFFAQVVYGITDLFLWPFTSLFASPTAGNGMVLEVSSFVALLVYAVAAWGVVQLIRIFGTPSKSRTVSVYEVDKH